MLEFEQTLLREKLKGIIKFNEKICDYSSIKIGGKVAAVIQPNTLKQLKCAIRLLNNLKLPYKIVGATSNLLFSDKSSQLIIISLIKLLGIKADMKNQTITCFAGQRIASCYLFALNHGLSGFEKLAGIPGTIGGAIINNAGAFGAEIKDILESVTVLLPNGRIKTFKTEDLNFGYRNSKLKGSQIIIISACFKLKILAPSVIKSIALECMLKRNQSQPQGLSLGSVFKKYGDVPAGKLIDEAGMKGYSVGGCSISEKHANFIVNNGGGTATDYKKIVKEVQTKIKKLYNLDLELEVEYVD